MERKIIGYHKDELNDWVADLDCHHGQHVRHNPPLDQREWVETEEGRNKNLGAILDCIRCNELEFPENLQSQRRTPEFSENTIPAGILKNHSTKVGIWGVINVLEGRLLYTVTYPKEKQYVIQKGEQANIAPTMLHSVIPDGKVKFFVEFFTKISNE